MILLVQLNDENSIEVLFDEEGVNLLKNVVNKDWKTQLKKKIICMI